MLVCGGGELVEVKHHERGIGDGFAEHGLRIGAERGIELFGRAVRVHEGAVDAHAAHGHVDEVVCAAVDGVRGDDMVADGAQVEQREEVRRLTGAREDGRGAALEFADLLGNDIVRRVGQAGIEIPGFGQVEQAGHLLAARVFECGGLDDRGRAWLAVLRLPAALDTDGVNGMRFVCRVGRHIGHGVCLSVIGHRIGCTSTHPIQCIPGHSTDSLMCDV